MELSSIKFLNFRRFRQQEINFNSGFSIIFGRNGAGKSSIIDAIGFCLFGAGIKDFSRGNTIDFKSYFIKDRLPSKVELDFVFAGENYKVVRVIDTGIKKFENDFIEEKNDTLIGPKGLKIVGGKEITDYLVKLFQASKDIFLKSVFTKQKDLGVLSGKKEDRKNLINSILGIDKIERIIKDFRKEEHSLKTHIKIIKQDLENFDKKIILENLENLKKSKKILKKDLKNLLEELENKKKNFLKIEKEYKILQEKRDKWQKNFNDLQKIKINIENSFDIIKKLKEDLQNLDKKSKIFEEKKFLFKDEEILKLKLEKQKEEKILFEQKNSLQKEEKILEEKIKDFLKNKKILKKEIKEKFSLNFEKEIKKLQEKLKEILQKKSFLENSLKQITEEGLKIKEELEQIKILNENANCPTCKRPLGDYAPNLLKIIKKDREEKLKEYKKISGEIDIFKKDEEKFSLELDFLEKQKLKKEELEKKLQIIEENIKNLEENLFNITEKKEKLKDIKFDEKKYEKLKNEYEKILSETKKLRILQGEIKKIDESKILLKKQENILKDLQENKKDLETKEKKIDFNKEVFEEISKKYENFSKEIVKQTENLQEKKDELNEVDKEIFKLDSIIQKNKNDEEKLKEILKDIEILVLKQKIFSDYSIYLLNYLKPKIEFLASSYFSEATDNKYTEITLDDEYRIKIDGKNLDLYSGGEQDLANLCLRIALGQNLSITNSGNMINFLILDEVLGSQDKTRQENILKALKTLDKKFSQIILISHIDDLKDVGDNLIEVKSIDRLESIINQQ